uniref:Uncharacterized protein n=1 Tax=Salix viminalis TaxID=40686 RepID=A0A6N2M023_SALVM
MNEFLVYLPVWPIVVTQERRAVTVKKVEKKEEGFASRMIHLPRTVCAMNANFMAEL